MDSSTGVSATGYPQRSRQHPRPQSDMIPAPSFYNHRPQQQHQQWMESSYPAQQYSWDGQNPQQQQHYSHQDQQQWQLQPPQLPPHPQPVPHAQSQKRKQDDRVPIPTTAPAPSANASSKPKASKRTKRKRKSPTPSSSASSESEDEGIKVSVPGASSRKASGQRPPGACTHCKKLKMKCDFTSSLDEACKRCKGSNHVCIVEGRKTRTAPNKREYLLAQIRQKDAIIESLLKQLHNPYIATPLSIAAYRMATSPSDEKKESVVGWLEKMQASVNTSSPSTTKSLAFEVAKAPSETSVDEDEVEIKEEEDEQDGDMHIPLNLIANLSLADSKNSPGGSKGKGKVAKEDAGRLAKEEEEEDEEVGVASQSYFKPGPSTNMNMRATLIEQHSPPEILVHGLVTPDDVERLFQIFFKHVNPFISLLDPVLHTPSATFARCPFLFTVVCAISSRFSNDKSNIYPIAMHFAKHAAANALIDGWKSVELCQAYILMSIYAVPARRWEEDRSWLYAGLAIRIATDLNLHIQRDHHGPELTEMQEREELNRTRTWLICFNVDRSTATQFGKPSGIREDKVIRNSADWYTKSNINHSYDVHLCAYTALLRIVAEFHDEVFTSKDGGGLSKMFDFREATLRYDKALDDFEQLWTRRFAEQGQTNDDPGCAFRTKLTPFLIAYSRLVMFSFGFQQEFRAGNTLQGDRLFLNKCLESAKKVIKCMIEDLAPSGYMRYAPDGHFIFVSFASAFLLKVLRPSPPNEFVNAAEESEILGLIANLIQVLSSPGLVAMDDRHTPKLYARFLAGLLGRWRMRKPSAGISSARQSPLSPTSASPSVALTSGDSEGLVMPDYNAPVDFGVSGGMMMGVGHAIESPPAGTVEHMPATMEILSNPGWWDDMMMPGFTWPGDETTPSPVSRESTAFPGTSAMGYGGYSTEHQHQLPTALYPSYPSHAPNPALTNPGYSAYPYPVPSVPAPTPATQPSLYSALPPPSVPQQRPRQQQQPQSYYEKQANGQGGTFGLFDSMR